MPTTPCNRLASVTFASLLLCAAEGPAARAGEATPKPDPRPRLLVEPSELAKQNVSARAPIAPGPSGAFVVLDARPRADFEKARVPGARWVDATVWAKAFGDGRDAAGWAERIGQLGIRVDSTVIVYDDVRAKDSGRIWWILRYWGIEDARLLDGGWGAYKAAGLPTESGEAKPPTATKVTLKPREELIARKEFVLGALKDDKWQILDARSEAEHCGTEALAKRGGAIPSAKHLDWVDVIDQKTGRFKDSARIRKLLADAGVDPARPVVTHCQSGGRASVMALALELVGAKEVRNYYASWAEWGNAEDTPIVPGKPKAQGKPQ
jgi:thiosulfate/3-mercaptopyruvate sulfurtransferase